MGKYITCVKSYEYAMKNFSAFIDVHPYVSINRVGTRKNGSPIWRYGINHLDWDRLMRRIDSMDESLEVFIRRRGRLPQYTDAPEYERKKFIFMVERYPRLTMQELAIKFKVA